MLLLRDLAVPIAKNVLHANESAVQADHLLKLLEKRAQRTSDLLWLSFCRGKPRRILAALITPYGRLDFDEPETKRTVIGRLRLSCWS